MLIPMLSIGIPSLVAIFLIYKVMSLRRIVPTNIVHIVQRGSATVSYGVGKTSNVYYEFPSWVPVIGVSVRELPVSNFDIELNKYSAYDKDRVPFVVDIKAFFHIDDTNIAAAKVSSFNEMKDQLENVVQGAVRSILAKNPLEYIMEERSVFGKQFTDSVNSDLKEWGVASIKNIELMDVRDAEGSEVIHQIMAKRMSAISMESRTEVASNDRLAEEAELEASKKISVKRAETQRETGEAAAKSAQAVGIAQAESTKQAGIANQQALSEVAEAAALTAKKDMAVVEVNTVRQAEITKQRDIISAENNKRTISIAAEAAKFKVETDAAADKFKVETDAAAALIAKINEAEGDLKIGEAQAAVILAKGNSEAEAEKSKQLASVTAQTTLATEIGENKSYQDYLIRVKEVDKDQIVEVAKAESLATAMNGADLKLMVNSGDINSGISDIGGLLSSKGGSQINGMIEAFKQTDEGKKIFNLLGKAEDMGLVDADTES